jgi:hypothetical protein
MFGPQCGLLALVRVRLTEYRQRAGQRVGPLLFASDGSTVQSTGT